MLLQTDPIMLEKFRTETAGRSVGGTIRSSILRHVMRNGNFMVTEIAEATGYSLTTIAKYVAELQSDGMIAELERVNLHTKGRKAIRYGVNPDSYYFLGIDMKTFELNIALINFIGEVVRIERHTDFRFENTHDALDELCNRVQRFIDTLEGIDPEKIAGANLNLSGRVDSRTGTSASVFNFEETHDTPLADILKEKLGLKIFIENDTKAMAYGEYMSGENKRYENLLYVNIGWGLGLGIVIDGKVYYGKDGYSGEFGHVHMYNNNILCHCGKKGCIETEVSGRAIHRKLIERINNGESSVLSRKVRKGAVITTNDIIEAAEREDPLCIELISQTGTELGHQLAGLINLFNPEIIIIGGNLAQAEPYHFLQPVELAIRKYSLKLMSQNVPVVTSALGTDAGVIGASLIARSKLFGSI